MSDRRARALGTGGRDFTIVMMGVALALAFGVPRAQAADGVTLPHGGYSPATDACLQCHDLHDPAADYVLMREPTVTATCATCHTIYQASPTGAYDPGYLGAEAGTAADVRIYRTSVASATVHDGHRLALGTGTYVFADGESGDGSHVPGGTRGLTAIQYLAHPETDSALAFTATAGLSCASCHTPHGSFGQMVPAAIGPPLLSSRPNHSNEVTVADWAAEGGLWCGGCHDGRLPEGPDAQHAGYALADCMTGSCHSRAATDFPHTGSSEFLP
jgi:predicted CXXCH cytochrome family protein